MLQTGINKKKTTNVIIKEDPVKRLKKHYANLTLVTLVAFIFITTASAQAFEPELDSQDVIGTD